MQRAKIIKFILIALLIFFYAFVLFNRDQLHFSQLHDYVESTGFWAPFVFILISAIWATTFMPATLIILLGGAVFGPYYGVLYSCLGVTLGGILSFIVSRFFLFNYVQHKLAGSMKRIFNCMESESWMFVAMTRLTPIFPFFILSYIFGLTRITLTSYIMGTIVGIFPSILAFNYLGYFGGQIAGHSDHILVKGLYALGFLSLSYLISWFVKTRKRIQDIV